MKWNFKSCAVGCAVIAVIGLFLVFTLGTVVVRSMSRTGPPLENEILARSFDELVPVTDEEVARRFTAEGAPSALRVTLDLAEGAYAVRVAEPGAGLVVRGGFDPERYDVAMRSLAEPGTGEHILVRVRPRRDAANAVEFGTSDSVEIAIPASRPLELYVRMRKGAAQIDLTGLPLERFSLDAATGETRVELRALNPLTMRKLEVRGRMGEVRLYGLGYADPREIDFAGSMGDFLLDFGGRPRGDAVSRVSVRFGNVVVRVPESTDVSIVHSTRFGNVDVRTPPRRLEGDPELDPLPPSLELDLAATFGNVAVQ